MSPNDDPLIPDVQKYLAQRVSEAAPDSMLAVSWQHFYGLYDQVIRGVICKYHRDRWDLDDCAQEVWLVIVGQLARLHNNKYRGGLRAWLHGLCRNITLDLVRRRQKFPLDSMDPVPSIAARLMVEPADDSERIWNQQLVHAALAVLEQRSPPESYQIFYLRRIEERSVGELAAQFNLPRRSIRERTERIERKFVAMLKLYVGKEIG